MKNDEILIVQDYLRITFGNEDIQIRKPENIDDLNSIFIKNSRIGNIFRDIDPDDKEVTYTVSIPISLSGDNDLSHQQYLINLFGTDKIFLTGRGSIDDSQEVYLSAVRTMNILVLYIKMMIHHLPLQCLFWILIYSWD
jgi:hypothetical protein